MNGAPSPVLAVSTHRPNTLPSLENLQCFRCAARLLNFREGARAMGLTPAAFGQRVQKLEEQLGVKLFMRTTRSVRLTEAGVALRESAENCLRLAEETVRSVRGETNPPSMDFVIGSRQELGLSWILPQLDRLEKERPWLQIHLYFGSGPDLLLRVRTMEIDCAVTSSRFSDSKLDSLRLHRENYVFCGSSSLLLRLPFREPEDAKQHTLLDVSAELPLFRYWKDAADGNDRLRFARVVWLGSVEAIRQRMLDGAGVGLLPEYLIRIELKNGKLRRILPTVEALHDYYRLVFRSDDQRRSMFEGLAHSFAQTELQ